MRSAAIVVFLGAVAATACGAPAPVSPSSSSSSSQASSSEGAGASTGVAGAGSATVAGGASDSAPMPSTGSAAGLRPFQKEALDHFDDGIKESLVAANKACGTTFKVTSDFSTYKEEEWSGQSVPARCASVLDGLAALCGRAHYKPEVVKSVAEIKCLFGGVAGSNTKPNLSHSGKTLTFKMHKDNANIQDVTTAAVQAKLDGK